MITKELLDLIRNFIAEIRKDYPNITDDMLDSNGEIYYMNGNDGTMFDWDCNNRCCEFYIFHKDEMGFIKLCVNANDTMTAYVYPNGEISPAETRKKKLDKLTASYIAGMMYEATDRKMIWDAKLSEINFPEHTTVRLEHNEDDD